MALVSRWDDDEAFSSTFHMSEVEFKERQKKSKFGIHEVYEMALEQHPKISVEDYFALEEKSEERYEYVDGRVYMMAGGTLNHDTIKGNLEHILRGLLRGSGCRIYSSDTRVIISPTRYYHPDVTVSCHPDDRGAKTTVEFPRLVAEVLSPSTEKTDYREKRRAYMACPTIETYLLVDVQAMRMNMYQKEDDGWWFQLFKEGDEVVLPHLNLHFSLADIYEDVLFEEIASEDKPMYVSGKTMLVEEYHQLEQLDDERYEYIDGKAYLMGGCSAGHSQIRHNMELIMDRVLDSGICHFFGYGVQALLRNEENGRLDYVYPDVTVSCNAADWQPDNALIEAPRVVVEVLFSRTELKDRREKLQAYLACPTIEAYILADSREPYVEMYYKEGKQCWYQFFRAGDEVFLPCLDARFAVNDVYDGMAFEEEAGEEADEARQN